MPNDQNYRSFVTRVLASGLAAVYLFSNVTAAYATESAFWGERRRAARVRFKSTSDESRPLYAQLPKNVLTGPDLSVVLGQVSPQSGVTPAELGKAVAQTADRRILGVAQAILPYGNIRFVRESKKPGAPLILHIQDVHGNLEAQKNMAEMMLTLARDHGVQLAGLEGATGPFATDEFKPYPDQEAVKKVAAYFMKKDILGGPEYAALASEKPITLWGIEDPALYQANVKAVKDSLAGRTESEMFLASLNGALDALKKVHYTENLQAFDKNQSLYDQGHKGLGDFVQTLTKFDGRNDAVHSIKFPNISRLLSALREENNLNFSMVEQDRSALVEKLVEKLTQTDLQDLVRRSVDLRGGKTSHNAYHAYLRALCARNGLSLSASPSLTAYMHYVSASEDIDREDLLKEMTSLETSAQDALTKTADQRKLVELSRDASRLKKLLNNEMTPDDWVSYQSRQAEIANLPVRLKALDPNVTVHWPEDMIQFLSPFESFCGRAMDRNPALTGRLLEKMAQDKQPVAILVAGGFHTEGLMDTLAKEGASVAVLTPKIGPVDTTHRYLDAFAQDPLPLEKVFDGEPIALKSMCGLTLPETIVWVHSGIVGFLLGNLRDSQVSEGEISRYLEKLGGKVNPLRGMKIQLVVSENRGVSISFLNGNNRYELNLGKKGDNFHLSNEHSPAGAMEWLNQLIFKGKLSFREYAIHYSWKIENMGALCIGLVFGLVSLLFPGIDAMTAIEIAHTTTWLSFAFGHFHDYINERRSETVVRNLVAWGLSLVLLSPLLFVSSLTPGAVIIVLIFTNLLSFPLHRSTNFLLDRWFVNKHKISDEEKTTLRAMVGVNWDLFERGGASGINPEELFKNLSNDPNNPFLFKLLGELDASQIDALVQHKEAFYSWFHRASWSPEFLASLAYSGIMVYPFNPGFRAEYLELDYNRLRIHINWFSEIRMLFPEFYGRIVALFSQSAKALLNYFLASPSQIRSVTSSLTEAIRLADQFKTITNATGPGEDFSRWVQFRISKPISEVIDRLIPLKVDVAYIPEYLGVLRMISPEAAGLALASYKKRVFGIGPNPLLLRHSLQERLKAISQIVPGGLQEFSPADLFRLAHLEQVHFNRWARAATLFGLTPQETVYILGEQLNVSLMTDEEIDRIASRLKGLLIPKSSELIYLIKDLDEPDMEKVKKLLEGVDPSLRDKLIKALTLLHKNPLRISWGRMLELKPEELNRWAGAHDYDLWGLVDYLGPLTDYVLKENGNENAIEFFLHILKTRDVSTAKVLGEMRQQLRKLSALGYVQNYLYFTPRQFKEDPKVRAKILIELNEWMKVSGVNSENPLNDLSRRMEALLVSYQKGESRTISANFLLKEMRTINGEAHRIRFKEITGLEFPETSTDLRGKNDRMNILMSLYYSISTVLYLDKNDSEKMKILIAEGLRKLVASEDKGGSLQNWVLEFPENREEMRSLIENGYDEKLWTEGIVMEGFSSGGQTAEQKETQRARHYHQIIEIAKLLGFSTGHEGETENLSGHKDAVDYIDSMLSRENEAIRHLSEMGIPDPRAEFDLRMDQLEGIKRTLGLFEESQSVMIEKPEPVTIRIQKHFLNESNAGVGVPGCFNPFSGIHKEMPVMHALEANTFFAMAYDKNGIMIANTVLVLTDAGVLVFGDYNKSSLNLSALWAEAWRELAKMTPGVILVPSSAGISEMSETEGSSVKDFILTRRKTLWVDPYFDFGETDEDGISTFLLTGIKVDRESLSKGEGFQKSSQLRKAWEKIKTEETLSKRGDSAGLARIGSLIAKDQLLNEAKAHRVLGRLKKSGKLISDVTREDISLWLKELGMEEELADQLFQVFGKSNADLSEEFRGVPDGVNVPGALGLWDLFPFSSEWDLAKRGWAEGRWTGVMYLLWVAGAMAFGFIPMAPPVMDPLALLAFSLTSFVIPSLAFGFAVAVLSIVLHRITGVKLHISETPEKGWPTVLIASFKSLSGLAGIPMIAVGVSLASLGGAFGLPWMILGVAAGVLIVYYGIELGAGAHQKVNARVAGMEAVTVVLDMEKVPVNGSQDVKMQLEEKLNRIFLSGTARPVWFDFNDLQREYRVRSVVPKNGSEFRGFLRDSYNDLPSMEDATFTNLASMLNPEPINMGEAVDLALKDKNFRVALARWAMSELVLVSPGYMGFRFSALRGSVSLENRVVGEVSERTPEARLIRAAKALALLRAAGSSLSDPIGLNDDPAQHKRDIEMLLSAWGMKDLSMETIKESDFNPRFVDEYNKVLQTIAQRDVWTHVAEERAMSSVQSPWPVPSGPQTGKVVYFNVDSLVNRNNNSLKIAEALKALLRASSSGPVGRVSVVLVTTQNDISSKIAEWTSQFGPEMLNAAKLPLLHKGTPGIGQLVTSATLQTPGQPELNIGDIHLNALAQDAKGRNISDFELWTDSPDRVVEKGNNENRIVNILTLSQAIQSVIETLRFLAISA